MCAVLFKTVKRGTGHGRLQGTLNRPSSSGELLRRSRGSVGPIPAPLATACRRGSGLAPTQREPQTLSFVERRRSRNSLIN